MNIIHRQATKGEVLKPADRTLQSAMNADQYFEECLQFLVKYDWIYNFQLTHFFADKIWEHLPTEWVCVLADLTVDELNQIPFGYHKKSWPDSLKQFIEMAIALTLPRSLPEDASPISLDHKMSCGMSPKKQQEVCHLARVVDNICKETSCEGIVDIGSGLGYLSLVLSSQFGYKILGIECEESRCKGAELRAAKYYQEELGQFQSRPFSLKEDVITQKKFKTVLCDFFGNDNKGKMYDANRSDAVSCLTNEAPASSLETTSDKSVTPEHLQGPNMRSVVHPQEAKPPGQVCEVSGNSEEAQCLSDHITGNICLIGLHCCGDLTPVVLKLFTQMRELKSLVVLSCCYHRMLPADSGVYYQFPLSKSLQCLVKNVTKDHSTWSITKYGLRLAAQETKSRWKCQDASAHNYHQNNVIFRGILEMVMQRERIEVLKTKRKLASVQHCKDFETYIDKVLSRVILHDGTNKAVLKKKMLDAYSEYRDVFHLVEPFTCLQVVMQGVLESLILKDRQCYLLEQDTEANLLPVVDDSISPRNVAILAWKKTS